MRKVIMLLAVLYVVSITAAAQTLIQEQAELYGAEDLQRALPKHAQDMMGEYDPLEQTDFFHDALSIIESAIRKNESSIISALKTVAKVLLILILVQWVASVSGEKGHNAAVMAGAIGIVSCCTSDIRSMIGLGRTIMEELGAFLNLLLPVMMSASTASGSVVRGNSVYLLTTMFGNLLVRFGNKLLSPVLYCLLGLSLADAVLQRQQMKAFSTLLEWMVDKGIKGIVYAYVGFLTITGAISAATDTAAMKAAKMTIAGMVPVVGGIISGATETVLAGAAFLKSTIGTFGMLAILAAMITPFIRIGISYILFKLTATLGGMFESRLTGLLETISKVLGFLLAVTAGYALIGMLSCLSFIKSVHI